MRRSDLLTATQSFMGHNRESKMTAATQPFEFCSHGYHFHDVKANLILDGKLFWCVSS